MSGEYPKKMINVNIHEFKTNASHYLKMMEAGLYKGVIVKRYNKPVAGFILLNKKEGSLD